MRMLVSVPREELEAAIAASRGRRGRRQQDLRGRVLALAGELRSNGIDRLPEYERLNVGTALKILDGAVHQSLKILDGAVHQSLSHVETTR